jgi:hypothetical protein
MELVSRAEIKAADEAVLEFVQNYPRLQKTVGVLRHGDVRSLIEVALEAAAKQRKTSALAKA